MNPSVSHGAAILLDFISGPESGGSYAVIFGHHEAGLPKPITSMTVNELIAAQAEWGRRWGSSAAGRYQFMPQTLTSLKTTLGLTGNELFTPDLQDKLGYALLERRGYAAFSAGSLGIDAFAKNLAQEWASFPVLSATKGAQRQVVRGQSYYAGDGLNKAGVRPEAVEAVLKRVVSATATIQPAPIPATRRVVKAALRDSGSRTITAADSVNKAIAVGGTGLTGLTILSQLTDALKSVPAWGYLLGGLIVLAVIFYFNRKIMLARIEDAISGANIGRDIGLVRPSPSQVQPEAVVDAQSSTEQQMPAGEAPADATVNIAVPSAAPADPAADPAPSPAQPAPIGAI